MVTVTFEYANGGAQTVEIEEDRTLMEGALYSGVDGIAADCGGELACATCHVVIGGEWSDKIPAPKPDEIDMLEFAVDKGQGSRLSCQIKVTSALDGLRVLVPASQY